MNLVIVESPTKAKTLNRFLPDKDYHVEATVGHIRDLPKSQLGVDVEHDFKPEWVNVKGKEKVLGTIAREAGKAKNILLATDPDREGEAIAWHIQQILKENKNLKQKNFTRVSFHEITKDAILEAIKKGGKLDENLFDAQQARRVLDRLVGYKLSPVLWRKVRRGLSAGRVQSVAVRLIVEKEREREAFKPEEFWEITAEVCSATPGVKNSETPGVAEQKGAFYASLHKINNKTAKVGDEKTAMGVLADLDIADYTVSKVDKKEARSSPPPPFTTSTLQQKAGQRLGWSAKNTMRNAQRLYEKGLITYHRTDSLNISEKAITTARNFINKEYGKKYLSPDVRRYKTKAKVAQEAHEAIRPTKLGPRKTQLSASEKSLYQMIWQRFIATQMAKAIYDRTKIHVLASTPKTGNSKLETRNYSLLTEGRIRKFDGWLRVYGKTAHDDEIPSVNENQALQLIEVTGAQQFTDPPARYSEATLIKKLEELGIGRPSTYAPTISTIQDRGYVEKEDGRLHPTPVGMTTNDFLVKHFPVELDYQFTAKMEDDLDEIADGKREWVPVIKEFYGPFEKTIKKAEEADREKIPVEKTGDKCPDCSALHEKDELKKDEIGEVVIRSGRFGKFLSCSRFPNCKYTAKYLETIGVPCPECGIPATPGVKNSKTPGVDDPGKHGEVIVKKSHKRKRTFYGCSRWPDCKWVSWQDPRKGKEKRS